MNYSGKTNLLKLKSSGVLSITGKSGTKKCVVIPIEDNNIFVSTDDNQRAKGAYIDFIAWETQNSQYGDTHSIRQSLSKDIRSSMNEEQLKGIPFLGNMKTYELQNESDSVSAQQAQVDETDDLPF